MNIKGKIALRSSSGLSIDEMFDQEGQNCYLKELVSKEIDLNKFYKASEEDTQFYKNTERNQKLEEFIERHDPQGQLQRKICGYHRFLKLKYTSIQNSLSSPDSFKRKPGTDKIAIFQKTANFTRSFLKNHQKLCWPIIELLVDHLDIVMEKRIWMMMDVELKTLIWFLKAIRPFCYRFSVLRALMEDRKNETFKSDINTSISSLHDVLLTKFYSVNIADFECFNEPFEKNRDYVFFKKFHLKSINMVLNLLNHLVQTSKEEVIVNNPNFEEMGKSFFQIFSSILLNFENFQKKASQNSDFHDFLFYVSSIISSSILACEEVSEHFYMKRDDLYALVLSNFDNFGLNTLECLVTMFFLNSPTEIKQALKSLGKYEVVKKFKDEGVDIGFAEVLNENVVLNELLIKVKKTKDVFSP